jgi:hypothetical protein
VLIAWWPTLGGFFLSDDFWMLELARRGFGEVLTSHGGWAGQKLRPLTMATFVIDHDLWGSGALGYRLTNLLIHLAAVLLAGRLARALSGSEAAALIAASTFAVLPLHSQAVTWICARADPLVGVFLCAAALSLLAFLRAGGRARLALLAGLAWAACLAKETGFVVPLVTALLVVGTATDRLAWRRGLLGTCAVSLVAVVWFGVRAALLGGVASPVGEEDAGMTGLLGLLSPGPLSTGLLSGTWLMLAPSGPELDSRPTLATLAHVPVALAALSAVPWLWGLGTGRLARPGRRTLRACVAVAACALVPLLPLAAWAPLERWTRLLYAPALFACVAAGMVLAGMARSRVRWLRALGLTLSAVTVLSWGVVLHGAQRSWRTAGELSREIVEALPQLPREVTFVVALGVPEEHRGAKVFALALDHAARRFAGWPADRRVFTGRVERGEAILAQVRSESSPHVAVVTWTGAEWRMEYLPGGVGQGDEASKD